MPAVTSILGKWGSADSTQAYIFLYTSDGKIQLITQSATTQSQKASTGTITTGSLQMVSVVFDSGGGTFYIDGSASGTFTGMATPHNVTSALLMGDAGVLSWFMDGILDEVGIWDVALSADDISDLYNSGSGLAYPFTVAAGNSQMMAANF